LDKPTGITSARAVARVKRLLPKGTKIGHTGTLDPLASGLLVLMIGRATRLSRYVTGLDKSYVATARFGAASDTLDAEGEITPLPEAPLPTRGALEAATGRFVGPILQLPPMASAVKVGGERLYKAHRRGEEVERQPRPVTVHAFDLLELNGDRATFRVSCSSGTYVRTLVADLAESLGTAAFLTALRRESVGGFGLKDAAGPHDLAPDMISLRIIHTDELVGSLPGLGVVTVGEEARRGVCNGRPLESAGVEGSFAVFCEGELLAVYRGDGERSRPEVVLCG